jgi:adenosylcobinamide-GDP ribazoletransferase
MKTSIAADLKLVIAFCTRLPLARPATSSFGELARASWALPVAGILVAMVGGVSYWLARKLGLGPWPAAAIAIATTMMVTGCLHEDGLADTADGFGGGAAAQRKLDIMRDSRIGTYGVCALIIAFALKWSALAAIDHPAEVAMALIVAHASARATLPCFMRFVRPIRTEGLSAKAGRPPLASAGLAALVGLGITTAGLGPVAALVIMLLLSAAGIVMGWLAIRQIGGQTGDVLGALEQVGETLSLLSVMVLQEHGWGFHA